MLSPKRTKYRKSFKFKPVGLNKTSSLLFGIFGLKALESARITSRQIEAARKAITRKMKRQGRLWLHLFPHIPVSSKPTEVRMGKGKGNISYWVMPIKPGKILFEIDGVTKTVAKSALQFGAGKLPILTKFIQKTDILY